MSDALSALAAVSLAAWLYLVAFRGGFWRAARRRDDPPAPAAWPAVVAVVPARNEAEVIGRSLRALLAQDYPGDFPVVVVDDHSADGTAEAARAAAAAAGREDQLTVVRAAPLPKGWTGKTWALAQGAERAATIAAEARYLLFTDADIEHDPPVVRRLVAEAEAGGLDLSSRMPLLHCESVLERLLIAAFVFFFRMLYPFAWVADPGRTTAAAAGGCMLVRRSALDGAGGVGAIKGALIDDCALAAAIKRRGRIGLELTAASRSIRTYAGLRDIWRMVARTAFAQLDHSAALLALTVAGMLVVYVGPPVAAIAGGLSGDAAPAALGAAGWLLMAAAFAPTLRLYGWGAAGGLLLPVAAFLFTLMTIDSARRHWLGRGAAWKGRAYGPAAPPRRGRAGGDAGAG